GGPRGDRRVPGGGPARPGEPLLPLGIGTGPPDQGRLDRGNGGLPPVDPAQSRERRPRRPAAAGGGSVAQQEARLLGEAGPLPLSDRPLSLGVHVDPPGDVEAGVRRTPVRPGKPWYAAAGRVEPAKWCVL